jgi:predicted DNA-binding transcriptional regulator YafY
MPRNAEVIRQWTVLREIEAARGAGAAIDDLAARCGVTTRTIRRDLQALEESGFPIYDDRSGDDGRTRWHLNGQAFKNLAAGLTWSELCALYFSRTLLESLASTAFRADVESAFDKLAATLPSHTRAFLDNLPQVIVSKRDPTVRRAGLASTRQPVIVARALEATIHHRVASLTYHSRASARTKSYLVHPYKLAYAQGGLYLLAHVPAYGEVRTFGVERIQEISLLEERFEAVEELPDEAFPNSLGVHTGPPQKVEIEFRGDVTEYVKSREWHASQQLSDLPDGRVLITLQVCLDQTLTSWILSFGPAARVLSPDALVHDIAQRFDQGYQQYAAQLARRG